uniref:Uncharacterized protein n=1 Tax=Theropithecus gelada TaxID=9565 RepID=A0A8D2K9E8_THEGE
MAEHRYSFSLTTLSPSCTLVQTEYALAAVVGGAPSVGIKAANGVVLALRRNRNPFSGWCTVARIQIRVLVHRIQKLAQRKILHHQEPIPIAWLVQSVISVTQEYTQSSGVCPFGIDLCVVGRRDDHVYFSQIHPELTLLENNSKELCEGENAEKRYNEDLELEDAFIHLILFVNTAILTLKESSEGQMTEDNIEVGIARLRLKKKRFQNPPLKPLPHERLFLESPTNQTTQTRRFFASS